MTLRMGVLGLGFMGKCHYETYGKLQGAKVTAICDVDERKRSGDWSSIAGNIGAAGEKMDLSGVKAYAEAEKLFADPDVDVVDITLPTFLHAPMAVKALNAGKHVVCEKPMALTSVAAKQMIEAARKAKRLLFISHCIRFWPAYAKAREIVLSGKHGKVLSATFRRVSSTPLWSWTNWLQTPAQSGLCALDLHIHDADFILYCFGAPKSVSSHYAGFKPRRVDHICTTYHYGTGRLVHAEGAWEYARGFPFSMSFVITMQKATLNCPSDLKLMLYHPDGEPEAVDVPAGDGYFCELQHFVECITAGKPSPIVPPQSAYQSVKLIEAEVKSALTGKTVPVKL